MSELASRRAAEDTRFGFSGGAVGAGITQTELHEIHRIQSPRTEAPRRSQWQIARGSEVDRLDGPGGPTLAAE